MRAWYNDATENFHTFRDAPEQPSTKQAKRGRELVVGDVVHCGSESRTITGFDPHPGIESYGKFNSARIMRSGDYGITIFDDDLYRPLSSGAYISSHLWWHHEGRK